MLQSDIRPLDHRTLYTMDSYSEIIKKRQIVLILGFDTELVWNVIENKSDEKRKRGMDGWRVRNQQLQSCSKFTNKMNTNEVVDSCWITQLDWTFERKWVTRTTSQSIKFKDSTNESKNSLVNRRFCYVELHIFCAQSAFVVFFFLQQSRASWYGRYEIWY